MPNTTTFKSFYTDSDELDVDALMAFHSETFGGFKMEEDAADDKPAEEVEDQASKQTDDQGDEKPDDEQAKPDAEADKGDDKDDEGDKPKLSHDDALAALAKTRKENADWRTKHRDLETKLEGAKTPEEVAEILATAKADRESAERALTVENVALKFKLPDDLAAVLKGDTREELEAHAKALQKYAPVEDDGDPDDLSGGLDPRKNDGGFDPVATSREARKRRY